MKPLALVGIGCMFPDAENKGKFWTNIKTGHDSIGPIPESHWRSEDYYDSDPKAADKTYSKMGGFLSEVEFSPMDYGILPNAIEATDTSQLLGLLAVEQALRDAGYAGDKDFDREKVSVILGVTGTLELVIPLGARLGYPRWKQALSDAGVDENLAADVVQRISDSYVPWQENSFPGLLGNVVAGRISKHFDLGGTNCACDAACGSSLSALNLGMLELAAGNSDMVITGGVDTFSDIFMYTCFSKTPALSPSGHARPYDNDSDGTTLGEGLGIVVIKRLEDAERDGDKIYCTLRGLGASSDGKGSAIYEPDSSGQAKALRRAYAQAGVTPDTIELIEGHGTGTRVGDAIEVSALHEVFGQAEKPWCALGSIKSQIGHTKASAGVAGLIKTALALHHKVLPPTIKVKRPHDSLMAPTSAFYVNTEMRPWVSKPDHPRRAGISALGFGGSNFHCLVEEHSREKKVTDWDGETQILAFSGADKDALQQQLNRLDKDQSWDALRISADGLRRSFDNTAAQRLVLVVEKSGDDIKKVCERAVKLLNSDRESLLQEAPGIYYGNGGSATPLAMLFPGQGAQYPGMLSDLAIHFPEFFKTLEEADLAYAETNESAPGTLTDIIYPQPRFDKDAKTRAISRLMATENTQPALGTVSLGAARVLETFGVVADAVAGHSYGELVALRLAGVISRDDFIHLSCLRGKLMAGDGGDRGSMAAVGTSLDKIEDLIAEHKLDLVLANRNTPTQGVLSGDRSEIDRACSLIKEQGLPVKKLDVAAAFHSRLVADAAEPFANELNQTSFKAADRAVFSNTTGEAYPDTVEECKALLARQLPSPVDFVGEIENMYASGMRTFVEAGPGGRLSGMVKTILADRDDVQVVTLDGSNGKRSAISDCARALAKLAALGFDIVLQRWDGDFAASQPEPKKKRGLMVSISGANHFKAPEKRPPLPKKKQPEAVAPVQPVEQAVAPSVPSAMPQAVASQAAAPAMAATHAAVPQNQNLEQALLMTQQSLQALQSLQEQTAQLHQQFLQGQQAATQSFMSLVQQQQQLSQGLPINPAGLVAAAPVTPAASGVQLQPSVVPASAPVTSVAPALSPAPVAPAAPQVPVAQSGASTLAPAAAAPAVAVGATLLEVVAEKTGYPVDMLELEMSLDGDLGIDSIKRVEILSALKEKLPQLPAVKPEDLGRLQTLGQIVEHLEQAVPAVAAAAPVAVAVDNSHVEKTLLAVVAEKTGYPVDMLELEMALDTDLGIDSIKRVEILSALQEKLPELPAVKPEDLGVLQTLGQIVAYLADAAPATTAVASTPGGNTSAIDRDKITQTLLGVVAEKTGYPIDMLEPEMALDTDLGIDSIKRVEILSALQEQLPELPAVKPEDLGVLQTLGQIVDHLSAAGTTALASVATGAAVASGYSSDFVTTALLEVIAEKTGYPVDMLELEMALDSDLGIDSIKRVEILSALQEQLPELPAVKPEDLGVLQTLGQIVDHLCQGQQQLPAATPPAPQLGQLDPTAVSTALLDVIADKTGYPVDMLELDMALDTDLGIDSIKRVEILSALQERLPGAPAVKPEHLGTLETIAQIVDFLASTGAQDGGTVARQEVLNVAPKGITRQVVKTVPLAQKRPQIDLTSTHNAPVWITGDGSELVDAVCKKLREHGMSPEQIAIDKIDQLEIPDRLAGLIILSPLKGADDHFLQQAFRLVRSCGPILNTTAQQGGAFLATISRMNGAFGLDSRNSAINDVLSGGLAGLCKTAVLEWPSLHGKAIDLAMGMEIASTAAHIGAELLRRSPLEVGMTSRGLQTLELESLAIETDAVTLPVGKGDLVVVSGGGRGVTAETAIALAGRTQATLLLLGRSALPEDEAAWLSGLDSEGDIKKAIIAQANEPLKPIEVQRQYQRICAEREISTTLERIRAAGGKALYRSVDLRDSAAVTDAIDAVRDQYGPVRGFIHGAGVLADKLIAEKTDEQFEMVYGTKVDGLRALIEATRVDELKFIALFSSSTGRFGRIGQVDYAVANEILNKSAQQLAAERPDCRVVAFNWGPWDGGMVTPALKKVFAQEGIEVIDLHSGAAYMIDELSGATDGPVELVVLGGDPPAQEQSDLETHQNIHISKAFDLDLSVDQYPFLKSHVIDGKAVLPLAVMVEWMTHGAMHNNPGLKFQGFNDLRVLKGVILAQQEQRNLEVMTGKAIKSDGLHIVPVELSSHGADGKQMVHARSRVVLATRLPEIKPAANKLALDRYPHADEQIYTNGRLFHGDDFHALREMIGCSAEGISALVKPAPMPQQWIEQPLRNSWFADPLALDAGFQMLILWSFEQYQAASLPVFAERYRQFRDHFPAAGVELRARILKRDSNKAVADIDFIDPSDGQLVARMENYECVIDASLQASFQRNKLIGVG